MSRPVTAESIRDAAALIAAVVGMDQAGQRAIIDNCDKDETLACLAGMVAMFVQQATGVDDVGLLEVVHGFVEDMAQVTNKGPGTGFRWRW